jgi:hypothetical protein
METIVLPSLPALVVNSPPSSPQHPPSRQSLAPSMMKSVDRIVIMGGDFSPSHLDLNFKMDPQAVELVMQAAHRAGTTVELVTVQVSRPCFPFHIPQHFSVCQNLALRLMTLDFDSFLEQLCMQTAFTDEDVTYLEELCSCNDDDHNKSSHNSDDNKNISSHSETAMPGWDIEGPLSGIRPVEERVVGESSKQPLAACLFTSRMHKQAMIMPRLINSALSSPPHLGFAAPSPVLRKGFIPWDLVALSRFLDKQGGDRGQPKESMLAEKTAEESSRDNDDGGVMYFRNISVRNGQMMWERADEGTEMRLLAATTINEARFKYEATSLLCGATSPRVAARGARQGLGGGLWMWGLLGELMVLVLCLVAGCAMLRRGVSRPR